MIKISKLEKNKQAVINDMEKQTWLKKDKWGNFLFIDDNALRYHHKKSVVCKQRKIGKRWVIIKTLYYKDVIKSIKNDNKEY